jgi:carboxyl-terminal processing protease
MFSREGELLVGRDRNGVLESFAAESDIATYAELPVTVLVDGSSASAAELVAASLQERGRGRVLGGRTFGKAVGQDLFPLPDGSGASMTTSQFFTPRTSPHQTGVTPDVTTERATEIARHAMPGRTIADPLLWYAIHEMSGASAQDRGENESSRTR